MVSKTFVVIMLFFVIGPGLWLFAGEYQYHRDATTVSATIIAVEHRPRMQRLRVEYPTPAGESVHLSVAAAFWQSFEQGQSVEIKVPQGQGLAVKLNSVVSLYKRTLAFLVGVCLLLLVIFFAVRYSKQRN